LHISLWQWVIAGSAAFLVGISKTGVPGVGILVVSILAYAFGGRTSVGIMLPMLIIGDCFAVFWYRRHAEWDKILKIAPWVIAGLAVGTLTLWITGKTNGGSDVLGKLIGLLVLIMLALTLLQNRLGDRITPTSPIGRSATGLAAGFTTMISNAAGPMMSIYLTAHGMPKNKFMGTIAWYFFIFNLSKLPVYFALSAANPANPMITRSSLLLDLAVLPVIFLGALLGKWMLYRIPQKGFETAVLGLAGLAAIKLIAG